MRQRSGSNPEWTERSGGAALISERRSRVKGLLLPQLQNLEGAQGERRGEGNESGEGTLGGEDHITLRTSKQSRQKRRRSRVFLSGAVQQLCLMSLINKPRV